MLFYKKNTDFKKEFKKYYRPKNKPEIINVPSFNFIAIRGKGNPNEENGSYRQAIQVLYAVAYTLKMSYKTDYQIKGFYQFVVPPLEGFWWQENVENVDYLHKEKERIMTAFDFGRNIYGEKTADDFFNKMYPQSCPEADA